MLTALLSLALAATLPDTTLLTDDWVCEVTGGLPGPEDLDVIELGGRKTLLVSSDERRPAEGEKGSPAPAGAGPDGGLFAVDWDTREARALPIDGRDACSFHPHGLTTRPNGDGLDVFVIAHYPESDAGRAGCGLLVDQDGAASLDAVEQLYLDDGGLRFVSRLQSDLMTEPNDVIALRDGGLLVSNNPEYTVLGLLTGVTLGRRPSDVLAYDGTGAWSVAARGFLYSNGLLIDRVGRLWVATYGGHLFGYDQVDGAWVRTRHLRLQGALDNIMMGEDGLIRVAGHPRPLVFPKHAKDPTIIGPSVVYTLEETEGGWRPVGRLLDESGAVNASSTATLVNGELVFGVVFDEGPIVCAPR